MSLQAQVPTSTCLIFEDSPLARSNTFLFLACNYDSLFRLIIDNKGIKLLLFALVSSKDSDKLHQFLSWNYQILHFFESTIYQVNFKPENYYIRFLDDKFSIH